MTSVVRASFLISIIFLSACSSDEISNYSGEIYGTSYIIKTTGKPSNDLKEKIDAELIPSERERSLSHHALRVGTSSAAGSSGFRYMQLRWTGPFVERCTASSMVERSQVAEISSDGVGKSTNQRT